MDSLVQIMDTGTRQLIGMLDDSDLSKKFVLLKDPMMVMEGSQGERLVVVMRPIWNLMETRELLVKPASIQDVPEDANLWRTTYEEAMQKTSAKRAGIELVKA